MEKQEKTTMMKQYIKPDKDDKIWIYDNGQKTKNFKTKEKAVRYGIRKARKMAKHVDVGLWIMRKNGTFEEERTYHARKPLDKDQNK